MLKAWPWIKRENQWANKERRQANAIRQPSHNSPKKCHRRRCFDRQWTANRTHMHTFWHMNFCRLSGICNLFAVLKRTMTRLLLKTSIFPLHCVPAVAAFLFNNSRLRVFLPGSNVWSVTKCRIIHSARMFVFCVCVTRGMVQCLARLYHRLSLTDFGVHERVFYAYLKYKS